MKIRKFLIILIFLNLLPIVSYAQNTISVGEYPAACNETITVNVGLTNYDNITGVQMEILLGKNLTYVEESASLAERTTNDGWSILTNVKGEGVNTKLKVLVYNIYNTCFTGNSGDIFTFQLTCGEIASENRLEVSGLICVSPSSGSVTAIAEDGLVTINAVTYAVAEHGMITGPRFAPAGDEVTVEVTPSTNYKLVNLYYTKNGTSGLQTPIDLETKTFTMPADAWVNVTAVFEEKQEVTVTFHNNGEITSSTVTEGTPVNLPEVSVESPFTFIGWKNSIVDYSTEVQTVDVESGKTTFTPTENCDLYTVFGRYVTSFTLDPAATINDCDGKEVIIEMEDNSSSAYYGIDMNGTKLVAQTLTTENAGGYTIAKNEDLAVSISQQLAGYAITNRSGLHLKRNGYGYELSSVAISSNDDIFEDPIGATNYIKCCVAGAYYLYLNNGIFSLPNGGNKSIYRLYVKNDIVYDYFSVLPTLISGKLTTHTYSGRCIVVNEIIIQKGSVVEFTGFLQGANSSNFTVEDGAQLIVNNNIEANVLKEVEAANWNEGSADNWYAIGIPNANAIPTSVEGLITSGTNNDYDLFQYVETDNLWQNYKKTNDFNEMSPGRGYLYASQAGTTINFKGNVNVENLSVSLTCKSEVLDLKGFNFIANPYTHDIYKGNGTAIDNSYLASGFYTLSKAGAWETKNDYVDAVKSGEAILVKTTNDVDFELINTTSSGDSKANNDFVAVRISNSKFEDVTYAVFGKGLGLTKIDHRNVEIPSVFINTDETDYAIAMFDDETTSFNVGTKVKSTCKMTLTVDTKGIFEYLHVVDRMTGEDVDMLIEEEYTFVAAPSDIKNRFIVNLRYNSGEDETVADAYQIGKELLVHGEGTFRLVDMLGRIVVEESINGFTRIDVSNVRTGAYIVIVSGTEVKTQKIIVK